MNNSQASIHTTQDLDRAARARLGRLTHGLSPVVLGVTRHHEQQVTFAVRQMLDLFSPSNFLLNNPEVIGSVHR